MIFTGSLLMVIVVSISGLQSNPFAMWWASAESLPQTSVRDPSSRVFSFCFVLRRTDCCGHFSLLHRWDFMACVGNREWLVSGVSFSVAVALPLCQLIRAFCFKH